MRPLLCLRCVQRAHIVQSFSIYPKRCQSGKARLIRRVDIAPTTHHQVDASMIMSPSLNSGWKIANQSSALAVIRGPSGYAEALLQLQHRFGIQFRNESLLRSALLNHGLVNATLDKLHNGLNKKLRWQYRETSTRVSNRTFEFLGDSVLGMAASSFVFQAFPTHNEGEPRQSNAAN
jgi:hypothetical protein